MKSILLRTTVGILVLMQAGVCYGDVVCLAAARAK